MFSETNESLPIETLKNRHNLSTFAIVILLLGVVCALIAVAVKYSKEEVFESTTFIVALFALLLSIPVMINRSRIKKILKERAESGS